MYIYVHVDFLSYSESEKDKKTSKDDQSKVMASVVEQLILPEGANVTGDRGNPHYAKELQEGNKLIGASRPLTGSPMGLPTFFCFCFLFFLFL